MKKFKGFILGAVTMFLIMTMINTVFAEQISKTITATYNSIKITIDGKQIEPKDANGNTVEPFVSGGTTYLPVRSIAEAVGYDVDWDSGTNTVKLTKKSASTDKISDSGVPLASEPKTITKEGLSYEITNTQEHIRESSFGDVRWETLIEMKNTGTVPIYFGSQKYDLTDTNGKILKTGNLSSFPNIIEPGEKGYFYDSVELTGATVDTMVKFVPRWDIKKSKADRIKFDLSDIDIREGQFGTTVYGKIANKTGEEQTWAIISVVLYAKDGSPIGVWMTNVMEDMPVGTSFGFEISGILNRTLYDKITPDMIGSYTAYAYPPQYQY